MHINSPDMMARLRARDPAALKRVVQAYRGQILQAARAAGLDTHHAHEVTQATFTTFLEKADRFEGRSQVRTWLFGILYKKIAEHRRQQRRESRYEGLEEIAEAQYHPNGKWGSIPQPADVQLYQSEVMQLIEHCLQDIPAQQRQAFYLREVEGLESKEICRLLGIKRSHLGVLLYRARARLRECLQNMGILRG